MKKIILTLAIIALSAGAAFAQDMSKATETAKVANEALQTGDKDIALQGFKEALSLAQACGDEGADLVATCKSVIPGIMVSKAKEQLKAGSIDDAIALLNESVSVAKEYEAADAEQDALQLIPQAYLQQGNNLLQAKDAAGAVAAYTKSVEADPDGTATKGMASLRLGMALAGTGKADEAIAAFEQASAQGQDKLATKQLSTLFLKKASASLKGKDLQGAIDAALKSTEYLESANAYKIAGTASNSLGNKADAVKYLSKYLELAPTAADAAQIKAAVEALKK